MIGRYFPIYMNHNKNEEDSQKKPSSWLVAPYFTLYFATYLINMLVWPLFLMERFCNDHYHHRGHTVLQMNLTVDSCINRYMANQEQNKTSDTIIERINNDTLNLMIVGSIGAAILSLISYFVIWKPTIKMCRPIAVFLPPMCILLQCLLFSYAQTINNTRVFKYVMLSSLLLPCLHSNFQGVLLLMFKLNKESDEAILRRKNQEIQTIKVETSYSMLYISFLIASVVIGWCFDLSYSVLFVVQFTMALLSVLYGCLLVPIRDLQCLSGMQTDETENNNDNSWSDMEDSSEDEEIIMMRKSAEKKQDHGLLSKEGNLFSEAPMIFSEASYRKEMLIIVEISVLTVAVISDSMISGPFLIQAPFRLTLRQYGYCIGTQGISKLFGIFITQTISYFWPCKHGNVIILGAVNSMLYFILLGVVQQPSLIIFVMVINVFGGMMFPAIASFIKINFTETLDTVLEISTISSLVVSVGFNGIEFYVYMKTRNVFPGAIFLLAAAVLLIGFVVLGATYLSTTVRNRRKTKDYADKLLNDYE